MMRHQVQDERREGGIPTTAVAMGDSGCRASKCTNCNERIQDGIESECGEEPEDAGTETRVIAVKVTRPEQRCPLGKWEQLKEKDNEE